MPESIENLKAAAAALEKELEAVNAKMAPLKAEVAQISARLRNTKNDIEKAVIGALGEWRPPAIDEYWRQAIIRKDGQSKERYKFTEQAFRRAGFEVVGINPDTKKARFVVHGLDVAQVSADTLRERLVPALKVFAAVYASQAPDDSAAGEPKMVCFRLGEVTDMRGDEAQGVSFDVLMSAESQICKTPWGIFRGEYYVENAVEEMLKNRARLMDFEYESSPSLPAPGM
jgi:hypothetical protein